MHAYLALICAETRLDASRQHTHCQQEHGIFNVTQALEQMRRSMGDESARSAGGGSTNSTTAVIQMQLSWPRALFWPRDY